MGEVRFMISEAAKQVRVESHVLRYWEEELALDIGRTEMGHRYYTQDDIQLFRCIKKLKNEGMLLKDLKPMIPRLMAKRQQNRTSQKTDNPSSETEKKELPAVDKPADIAAPASQPASADPQVEQMRGLIGDVLAQVVSANNKMLEQNISQKVTSDVLREMDFLFQAKERREEEHFRKLDCLIRQQQASRKESAKETPIGRFRKMFT